MGDLYQALFGAPFAQAAWPVLLLVLLVGFALLAQGAHWLVDGGARLASRMGMSTLVVGLTVVAWGTSAPEVVVSGMAAARGSVASALGNVLGSNLANIGLVLGCCAVVLPKVLEGRINTRELLWLGLSLALLWYFCLDHVVTRFEGLILLLLFAVYTWQVWFSARDTPRGASEYDSRHPIIGVVVGSLAITAGAWLALESGSAGALRLGIDELLVGLTVLALGTSLPELAAGLKSAFQGHSDISIGNVIGSNVFNTLAVIGIASLIHPFEKDPSAPAEQGAALDAAFEDALRYDFPAVLAFSAALILTPGIAGRLSGMGRFKGFVLLGMYATYWLLRERMTG